MFLDDGNTDGFIVTFPEMSSGLASFLIYCNGKTSDILILV